MNKNFSTFKDENGITRMKITVNLEDKSGRRRTEEIAESTIEELFCKKNLKPFMGIGKTNSGKSFFSVDLFLSALRKQANFPFFFTSTISSDNNTYLREFIPSEFVHNFDIGYISTAFSYLKYFNNMVTRSNAPENIKMLVDKYGLIGDVERAYINKVKSIHHANMVNIIKITDLKKMTEKLPQSERDLIIKQSDESETLKYLLEFDMSSIRLNRSLMTFADFIAKLKELNTVEDKALTYFYQAVLLKNKNILNPEDEEMVNNFNSDKANALFIFDDVTSSLATISKKKELIKWKNYMEGTEPSTPARELATQMFYDIFNEGRHHGLFIFLVHAIDTFDPTILRCASNFIFFSRDSIMSVAGFRGQSPFKEYIKDIETIQSVLDTVNSEFGSFYKLVFFADPTDCPNQNSHFAFFSSNKVEKKINPDECNESIKYIVNAINKASAANVLDTKNVDDDLFDDNSMTGSTLI